MSFVKSSEKAVSTESVLAFQDSHEINCGRKNSCARRSKNIVVSDVFREPNKWSDFRD